MIDAAIRGSIGSVAILMRILAGRPFFTTIDTVNLTPTWRPDAPDTLAAVTERYKLRGANLAAAGYTLPDYRRHLLVHPQLGRHAETWYPSPARHRPGAAHPRPARSVTHGLGFVPIAWIRNLPGASWTGDDADGACTFRAAIETGIEIDYQLSQAGRGLKYSSDPTLLIKEPAGLEGDLVRGAGNALIVSEHGDAKLLEIGGTASSAVIEYVRTLREFALESVHGNRADASRLAAATSGRALELMNQGLLWLADNLRISYGEGALLTLARMVLRAGQKYQLRLADATSPSSTRPPPSPSSGRAGIPETSEDRQRDAATLTTLVANGQLSRETALKILAPTYDIEDVPAELARIPPTPPHARPWRGPGEETRPIPPPHQQPTHARRPPTPDPTDSLRQQLAAANTRLVQAELKAHAIRAGIIDLDCLKLLDMSALQLDDQGNLPEAAAALATLKRDKPWLFAKPNSSHPAPPPAPNRRRPAWPRT